MDRRQILIAGGSFAAVGRGTNGWALGEWDRKPNPTTLSRLHARRSRQTRTCAILFVSRLSRPMATIRSHGVLRLRLAGSRSARTCPAERRWSIRTIITFSSASVAPPRISLWRRRRGGYRGTPIFDSTGEGSIIFPYEVAPALGSAMFDAIPRRQSTRADYDGRAVSAADLATLATAAEVPGVDMAIITDQPRMDRIRDLVLAGNSAQTADRAFVRKLKSWLRFSPRNAIETGDGLYSVASGNPALPKWLGPRASDMLVTADSENDRYASQLRSSSGVAVFVGQRNDREHWALTGRACQRFALQATALGLKHA